MPINIPGILAPFHVLISPRLVVPSLIVKDIRQLDFFELRKAGYRGAVFDKDNCLTLPHQDRLVPELTQAWTECRETFGDGNVLVVSNSAGTPLDPGEIQAESVTYHLSVPVLRHRSYKPSYSCISSVRKYFASLPNPVQDDQLIIVGDRIFTDVVLANRMSRHRPAGLCRDQGNPESSQGEIELFTAKRIGPLSIWTSGIWERENMPLRWIEQGLMQGVKRWITPSNGVDALGDLGRFVKELPAPEAFEKEGVLKKLFGSLRRT